MSEIYKIIVPTPFKVGPVNLYLLKGNPITLVDTGPKTEEAFRALKQEVERMGVGLEQIEQIVITHAHHDHFGMTRKLVDISGAKTIVHKKTAPWLINHNEAWLETAEYFRSLYIQAGVSEEIMRKIKQGDYKIAQFGQSAPVDVVVEDGSEIVAGGDRWKVIYTPGHSNTCMCLLHVEEGWFISGDHLLPDISSNPLLEPPAEEGVKREPNLSRYMDSLKKTAELPIKQVFPGHGDNFFNPQHLIEERIKQFELRQNHIFNMVSKEPALAIEICYRLFPKLSKQELFLGLSETFGHLDILVAQGKINKETKGEVDLFFKD
ncbi:glyoxylase-like metal-dependent hydrolase (beta-lactamase superfamily II) [Desulfitispora alkaliphila]|uniref:MBL fold metallo-hydrolase n=1 Tax=Desulfitispora alkaliphila TaxID=622674 RepID=UPI003D1B5F3C